MSGHRELIPVPRAHCFPPCRPGSCLPEFVKALEFAASGLAQLFICRGRDMAEMVVRGNRNPERGTVVLKFTLQLRVRVETRPTKGFP